jgi:hypothetical protein
MFYLYEFCLKNTWNCSLTQQSLSHSFKKIQEARAFNFTYRYIDDVLSINNSRFAEFLPLIYPPEVEVKETTDQIRGIRPKMMRTKRYLWSL